VGITIKIAITTFLLFLFLPFDAGAEVIYLKDGTVIKAAKVWEEDGLVRFYLPDYDGITITYTKDIVERIEKDDEKSVIKVQETDQKKEAPRKDIKSTQPEASNKKTKSKEGEPSQAPLTQKQVPATVERKEPVVRADQKPSPASNVDKAPAPVDSKTAAPSAKSQSTVQKAGSQTATAAAVEAPAYSQYDDVLFYNPRRTYKYWSGPGIKHNTLKEAVAALAAKFDSPPEWVEKNLGDTNSLGQIYRNLSNTPVTGSAEAATPVKAEGFQFYDPRRQYKYWVSERSKHRTLDEAVEAFARQYGRPPVWIKAHLGETNDLGEIHQNLAGAKAAESAKD
jgi:hypothetical protein